MKENTSGATGGDGGITDSPLRGPTLSTSTSSFEALDPHDPSLSRLATKMFHKTNEYISHELNTCLEDYRLLEDMNRATISKYSDMNQIAENLAASSTDLKQKYEELVSALHSIIKCMCNSVQLQMPFLNDIDDIVKTVNLLEAAVFKLDAYSIQLEEKFNNVIKKK